LKSKDKAFGNSGTKMIETALGKDLEQAGQ
jgi:hypothetical protein